MFFFGLAAVGGSASAQTLDDPAITSFYPTIAAAGDIVLVYGTGLGYIETVLIGGTPASLDLRNDTVISLVVPQLPHGEYDIELLQGSKAVSVCCLTVGPEYVPQSPTSCRVEGFNRQCNALGEISMPTDIEILGQPVTIHSNITIAYPFSDQQARWIMFSVRHVSENGPSPVTIEVRSFGTSGGEVFTSKVDQPDASQVQAWVDVLDIPLKVPIVIEMNVGSTEKGAYRLETLVMPFDRFYQPINDADGEAVVLYSSTMLGVNGETDSTFKGNSGSLIDGNKMPGFAGLAAVAAVAFAALLVTRIRRHRS